MSTISCTIRGNAVVILTDTSGSTIGGATLGMSGGSATTTIPTITAAVEVRDVLKLTVIDASGTAVYYRGDPVVLTDSVAGVLYSGYVQTSDPTKLSPDPASTTTFHTITCMDKQYLFDKRTNNQPYLNMVAGDIAADLVRRYGAQEGVTMAAAMDRDTVPADFAAGTLTNTVATSNVGDGDLELATQGSPVTITETTTADFATGTLTSMTASGNSLVPTTVSGLTLSAFLPFSGALGSSLVMTFWSGSKALGTNDTLNFDIWITSTSPAICATVGLSFSDGTQTTGLLDQNGLAIDAPTDLSAYAKDQWYSRAFSTTAYNGKTVQSVWVALGGQSQGTYTVWVKNVYLTSAAGSPFFSTSAVATNVNPPQVNTYINYIQTSATSAVKPVFVPTVCMRTSPAYSIDAVKLLRGSVVAWNAVTPGTSAAVVAASYDGVSYQPCSNAAALPALPPGSNVAGLNLTLRESFTAGPDPSVIPALTDVTITLSSAAAAAKSDIVTTFATQTQWNTGTLSGVVAQTNGDLTSGSVSRNWNDNLITSQTWFPIGSVSQAASSGKYGITTPVALGSLNEGLSRLDFAGSFSNFILEFDISIPFTYNNSTTAMIIYRQTYWAPTPDVGTGGYTLQLAASGGATGCTVWKGTNSATSTLTSCATSAFTGPTHVKIVCAGASHQIYFNGSATPTLTFNDSTFTYGGIAVASYVYYQNPSGSPGSGTITFDNLTVTPIAVSTWTSPSTSISSLGTSGGSVISWTERNTTGGVQGYLTVQSSVDGGSTYQACTNGAAIANIAAGTSVSGKSVKLLITLYASNVTLLPIIRQLVWRVLGAYPGSSGTRVNPVLSLTPAGRAGASSVSWNATLPTGTSLVVATSPDNITYTTIAASGNPVASIYSQPAPQIDVFTTNTLANYTNTFKSGGSVATVTYTTASSLLTLAGGSGAVYLYTAISRADVDLICDMDRSDAGGLVWRFVNNLNYYELGIYDDSSSGGFTSQARLYKVAAGTRTLLGSASPIVFPRSTPGTSPYQRVHVTMAGAVITVFYEGVQVQSYTDGSPLAAGQMGLRNDGGTSRYYQLRLQPLGDLMTGQNLYIKETLTTSDPAMMPQLLDLTASVRGPGLATGALIPQLHAPTVPIAEFLNTEMNTITTASGDYYWNISNAGALSFAARSAVPAPWCLYSTDLIYEANVTPTSTSDLYRNQQNITNCTGVTALLHEQMVTDGSASSWKTLNPIYSAPAISVQSIAQTVGVQSVDTGKQFYWTANSVSFGQDAAAIKLPAGYIIDIWYVGQFITTVTVPNAAEQTARAAVEVGTSGIIEASENGQGMLASAATTYAQGLLARYGLNNAVQVVAATKRAGLAPGMLLPVFLPEHSLGNAQMLVTGVTTTMQQQADGSVLYFYQITATQGSNLANWTKVFGF